jgi:hypothetical protein
MRCYSNSTGRRESHHAKGSLFFALLAEDLVPGPVLPLQRQRSREVEKGSERGEAVTKEEGSGTDEGGANIRRNA